MNDSEESMKFCPHCGTKLDRKANFCFACGSELEEDIAIKPEEVKRPIVPGTGYPESKIAQKREQISAKLANKKEKITVKLAEKKEIFEVKKAQKKEQIVAKLAAKKENIEVKKAQKKEQIAEKKKVKKSYRKGLIAGIIISCLVFSIIGFFIVGALTFSTYQESFTFYYNPSSPASIEECSIYADTAGIQIQYNTTPVSYYAKVDVDFQFSGLFMAGKTYQNFFNPISWDDNTSADLSLTSISWAWVDPTNWFKLSSQVITLTLRTDVIYDISATSITGGVSLTVPENVTVNDLSLSCTTGGVSLTVLENVTVNDLSVSCVTGGVSVYGTDANFNQGLSSRTTTGGVLLNFTRCRFGNNIAGSTITGGVTLNMYNAEYTQDITCTLSTTTGGVSMNIQQYVDMGANVTGTASAITGGITVIYKDALASVGARFTGSTTTGGVTYNDVSGFTSGTSNDYSGAIGKYTISSTTVTGGISITGTSA